MAGGGPQEPRPGPSRGASAPGPGGDTSHGESAGGLPTAPCRPRGTAGGMGHAAGRQGRALWDCVGLTTGCTGEEGKAGKGTDQGGLGRNKHGKIAR